ncbi:NAD(P)/FAD-dependent oxidoreductase [Blastochloris sulfoviridis]|uniref:FAD-dependent oxidoreductase n=1 Tax=Blastochloris sulfoviridis TaxID=50712 RepID=A0A5M6I2M4_9HYPH|nr:FAD-dependent oxidoreductase [Blastochloris sulfoviridis]KAA5602129.1 FAD-dependent oxidoreductase [Blastochloris sulfoviridis]
MRIAVIGSGIAGNAAAWALSGNHAVVLYEREPRPGGHSHTVDVDYDSTPVSVDTGFIVYNERNYPNFTALLAHLGVASHVSDMSFALSLGDGAFEWSGQSLDTVFAQRSNLVSPGFLWMLKEIWRFNTEAPAARRSGDLDSLTLGVWLDRRRFSRRFIDHYIVPMGAAIWSTPFDRLLDFPAASFVSFFENHRLVNVRQIVWRTVTGGSRSYVDALIAAFRGTLRLATPVAAVRRTKDGVEVVDRTGAVEAFDQVVFATHAPDTLALLADASEAERDILSAVPYRPNRVFLHRDTALMPKRRKVWSSWNVTGAISAPADGASEVAVTYWMNRLQGIDPSRPLFVSLNPVRDPDPDRVFRTFEYDHPQYDGRAIGAQARLATIQGANHAWFAGAWTGYGFHEDGLVSGLTVAEALGGVIPWRTVPRNVFAAAA